MTPQAFDARLVQYEERAVELTMAPSARVGFNELAHVWTEATAMLDGIKGLPQNLQSEFQARVIALLAELMVVQSKAA